MTDETHVDQLTDALVENAEQDRFGRAPFAERIARTIAAQTDPGSLVVGIYGAWGDGKTSVLRMVENAFEGDDNIVVVRFNPWQLGDELAVFRGFFATVADRLDAKLSTGAGKIGEMLKNYGALLRPIPFAGGMLGDVATAAGTQLAETMADLDGQKARIEKVLRDANKRVVIFMDDLDRLDRNEIQVIFRLVKVAADFQNTAYVLAFDDQVVSAALAERYATGSIHGTNFLEKIVQLPLHLPPVDAGTLRTITLEAVESALEQLPQPPSIAEVRRYINVFDRGVALQLTTPRMSKRYGNALTFALPMIADEANVVDLLLIEAMRIFYPRLYEWVRSNPDAVLQTPSAEDAAAIKAAVDEATSHLRSEQRVAARLLLTELFPRTELAWQNKTWGSDWNQLWSRQRRVASPDYFDRYFTYSVGVNDIGDLEIARLLGLLETTAADAETTELFQALASRNAERLLAKLRDRVGEFSDTQRAALVVELVVVGPSLSARSVMLSSQQDIAGRLVTKIIEPMADALKHELAVAAVQAAAPLSFAFEVFRWLRVMFDREASAGRSTIDDAPPAEADQSRELGELLGVRVEAAWKAQDLDLQQFGQRITTGLWLWTRYAGTSDHVRSVVTGRLNGEPALAIEVLRSTLPTAWAFESGMPLDGSIGREQYDQIVEFFDVEAVIGALTQLYGDDLGGGDSDGSEDVPLDERISRQFALIHEAVKSEHVSDTADVEVVPPESRPSPRT